MDLPRRPRRGARLAAIAALLAAGAALTAHGDAPAEPWSAAERATLGAMRLSALPPPPADPTNAVASRPEAAALGRALFTDPRLSRDGRVSCATCHVPERGFQDDRPLGRGLATGQRRTMPIAGAAYSPWLFWDGRKDSLWSQALGPLEDAAEHGANRAQLARLLAAHYRAPYEAVFGPLPSLAGVPAHASPLGNADERAAWAAMTEAQRHAVDQAFANLGKAIAAYERTVRPGGSRFDRYVTAVLDRDAEGQRLLSAQEVNGLRLFIGKARCATCHQGPLLTDQHFHNTGVPPLDPSRPDRGRMPAVARVREDPFNCLGPHSDAPPGACQELAFIATDDPGMEGAFKTPSLRDVARRAPYMHAGQLATLEEVVAHYARAPEAAVGRSELRRARPSVRLSAQEAAALVAFLGTLDSEAPAGEQARR